MEAQKNVSDRYYRAIYDRMLAGQDIATTKKLPLFFNLLFKTMKGDTNKGTYSNTKKKKN